MSLHLVDIDLWDVISIGIDDGWKLVGDHITNSHGEGGFWLCHEVRVSVGQDLDLEVDLEQPAERITVSKNDSLGANLSFVISLNFCLVSHWIVDYQVIS